MAAFIPDPHPFTVRRYREGDERFWALAMALAKAVTEAGALSWRQAREILREADPVSANRPACLASRSV